MYDAVQPSVLRMRWTEGKPNDGGVGTAFAVDGYLATCHHIIRPSAEGIPRSFFVEIGGKEYPVAVVAKDLSSDLALLRLDTSQGAAPLLPPALQLGWASDLKPGNQLHAFGFPALSKKLVMTEGQLINAYAKIDCPSFDPLFPQEPQWATARVSSRAQTWNGNFGGPLIDKEGKVVGVVTSGLPNNGESFSSAVEHLRLLIQRARQQPLNADPIHVNTLGRVLGKPGDADFKVSVDAMQSKPVETMEKPNQ
jgi:S1-C subfamily serine protease